MMDWFKTKPATTFFATIAIIGGLLFLNYRPTGGVILGKEPAIFNPLSLIGALLILCGIILGVYTLKKEKSNFT